jgi:8-oxo-dGTP pyrophosphatase MutT (NUDIX family)
MADQNRYSSFLQALQKEACKGLPGTEVQYDMASSDRHVPGFLREAGPGAREGAVLILLYPCRQRIYLLFTQRPVYQGIHSGQISFPGGKRETGDASLIDTALREYTEETGAPKENPQVILSLTPLFIPVSNIKVLPVIAWAARRPVFKPDAYEVEYLIEEPLGRFFEPGVICTREMQVRDEILNIKYYNCQNHRIWGATAMMLNELLVLIRRGGISLPE